VLAYAAEEAERLAHKHIGTEHLLLGLLREKKSFAAQLLNEEGVTLERTRENVSGWLKTIGHSRLLRIRDQHPHPLEKIARRMRAPTYSARSF
jgi:ATP-dependent Clp protease ATP-binding subunit ClpA